MLKKITLACLVALCSPSVLGMEESNLYRSLGSVTRQQQPQRNAPLLPQNQILLAGPQDNGMSAQRGTKKTRGPFRFKGKHNLKFWPCISKKPQYEQLQYDKGLDLLIPESEPAYPTLKEYQEYTSKAFYVLFVLKQIRENLGANSFPHEVVFLIFKHYIPEEYHLDLTYSNIDDNQLLQFPKVMTGLTLTFNIKITDEGLKKFVNLVSLDLINNDKITDEGIRSLIYLNSLNLTYNQMITNKGIELCLYLTNLDISRNKNITDEQLKKIVNLIHLNLRANPIITDEGVKPLLNLMSLNLRFNRMITDNALMGLSNLTNLDLTDNNMITNGALENLPNLESLNLWKNETITNKGLEKLPNLRNLDLSENTKITKREQKSLPKSVAVVRRF